MRFVECAIWGLVLTFIAFLFVAFLSLGLYGVMISDLVLFFIPNVLFFGTLWAIFTVVVQISETSK